MITYRVLPTDEWGKLKPLLASIGKLEFMPDPQVSFVAVAEEDDRILGCLFMQLVFHMEPLVLTSPQIRFDRLYDALLSAVQEHKGLRFYTFSDKEVISRMAAHV